MSKLALDLIAQEKENRTGRLDLGNCDLTELPAELFDLVWLEVLNLNSSYWDRDKQAYLHSVNLGGYNDIVRAPTQLGRLSQLRVLYWGGQSHSYLMRKPGSHLIDAHGLGQLKHLETLDLSRCGLKNLSFLTDIPHLRHLRLDGAWVRNWPQAELRLSSLHLGEGYQGAMPDWELLPELEEIILPKITELPTGLREKRQLKKLHIHKAQLTDLTGLKELTELVELSLDACGITALSSLPLLPNLSSLSISRNRLNDLGGLTELPALTSLDVSDNQLTSLSGLESLPALTSLYVSDNQLTSLSGLESLPALTSLYVSDNQLTSLSDIPASFTLRVLSANKNKLTSFRQLPDLPLLQRLYIRGNKIADWQGLSRFTHLLHLVAGQNDFSELADFPLLPRLRSLDLRGCSVAELRPLAQLPDLQNLVADDCPKLKNIACLPDFPELVGVSLQHNTFDAIKPLH